MSAFLNALEEIEHGRTRTRKAVNRFCEHHRIAAIRAAVEALTDIIDLEGNNAVGMLIRVKSISRNALAQIDAAFEEKS